MKASVPETPQIEASVPKTPQNGGISTRNTTKWMHQRSKQHKMETSVLETPQNGGISARNTTK
jgi:hypothetical protein